MRRLLLGKTFVTLVILYLIAAFCQTALAAWQRDSTFNSAINLPAMSISQVVQQPSGKLIVEVQYSCTYSSGCTKILRLNLDGTIDPTFSIPALKDFNSSYTTAIPSTMLRLAGLQTNGKPIIYGKFVDVGATYMPWIARLDINGNLDGGFRVNFNPAIFGPCGSVTSGAPTCPPGVPPCYDSDCTLQSRQKTAQNLVSLKIVKIHPSDKVLIVGSFCCVLIQNSAYGMTIVGPNGAQMGWTTYQPGKPFGTQTISDTFVFDADFRTSPGSSSDGPVVFGGSQGMIGNNQLLVRMNNSATTPLYDSAFSGAVQVTLNNSSVGAHVSAVKNNPFTGDIFFSGNFDKVNGTARNKKAMVDSAGALKSFPNYADPARMDFGLTNYVSAVTSGVDDIYVAKHDGTYQGKFPLGFTGGNVRAVKFLADGRVVVAGSFTLLKLTPFGSPPQFLPAKGIEIFKP